MLLFAIVLLGGCATRSFLAGDVSRPVSEASVEELRLIEIARQAVTAREGRNGRSWADSATYEIRRKPNGWSVWVLKTKRDWFGRPLGYALHSDRFVTIDEDGNVTNYFAH